jgi:DNA-directed RNA polymerase subunit K/omega
MHGKLKLIARKYIRDIPQGALSNMTEVEELDAVDEGTDEFGADDHDLANDDEPETEVDSDEISVTDEGPDDDDLVEKLSEPPPPQIVNMRKVIVVPDDERITSHVLSKFEVTWAIATRAKQISDNPKIFTDVEGLDDAKSIARKEFYDKKSPLVLERLRGYTKKGERIIEKWKVREMTYPPVE